MKETKGRSKTGQQATVRGLWPRSRQLSPAWSRSQPSFEQQAVPGNQPCSRLPAGTVRGKPWGKGVRGGQAASAQPSPGRKARGRGGSLGVRKTQRIPAWRRASWGERAGGAGAESDGAEQGAHGRPFIHSTGTGTRQRRAAGGVAKVSLLPWLVGERGPPSSPGPGQRPLGLSALPLSCPTSRLTWEKKSLGMAWQGTLPWVIFPV